MIKQKRQPIRTCIVCRRSDTKMSLVRLVKGQDGRIAVDPSGRLPGRGAYICRNLDCIDKIISSKIVERALKTSDSDIDKKELLDELRKLIMQVG